MVNEMQKTDRACRSEVFHCPHCGVYAKQEWHDVAKGHQLEGDVGYYEGFMAGLSLSFCSKCWEYALWHDNKMIYPVLSTAPPPVGTMPPDVREHFLEARDVFNASPQAAAALLRLALQKLMVHLGERGKNLDHDIADLREKGLPPIIQDALGSVRFIGDDAARPGQISSEDNACVAATLFDLVNMIVEIMLSHPEKVNGTCEELRQAKLADKRKKSPTHRKRKRKQKERKWNPIFYR